MMNKKFVRVLCIFLAILMLGSVLVVAIQAFALDNTTVTTIANTGDGNVKTVLIVVAIIAIIALLGVTVAPMVIKKIKG